MSSNRAGALRRKSHSVDFMFPAVLFFVFALSAVILIVMAAGVYRSAAEGSARSNNADTAAAYLTEKLHRADEAEKISTGTFEGAEAVIITEDYDGITYYTCIYYYDGALREIFYREGAEAGPADGTVIAGLDRFQTERISPNLFRFTCADADGHTSSVLTALRSGKGGTP